MIIGIDASRAVKKQRTGTENYSRSLIFWLANIDKNNHYRLYVGPDYAGDFNQLGKNFELKIIANKKYWTQVGLSFEMIKRKPDVLFVPSHLLPPITPTKTVVTIHDLAWKYFPEAYSKANIRIQEFAIRRAIKRGAEIIVYSDSTASDLKQFYKVDGEKIHFVPMGFDQPKQRSSNLSQNRRDEVGDQYLLFVGRLELKKNLLNLIRAYEMLRGERKIQHRLVLVGKEGHGFSEIKEQIDACKYSSDIITSGFVTEEEKNALYNNASLLVFPSLFEGFGFPILEAYAAGIPVITSNLSSMPQVAGKGAILVNPEKPFEIAAAISQILNKPDLASRLIRAGKDEIKKYSWERCAQETLKVLTETK